MRIITSSKLKDYYDRFSDPTDNFTVWVRTPEGVDHPILSRHYRKIDDYTPKAEGCFLTDNDPLYDEAVKKQGDYGPFDLRNRLLTTESKPFTRSYQSIQLVFCGVMYRGIMYAEQKRLGPKYGDPIETRYRVYWTLEQFAADHAKFEGKTKYDLLRDSVLSDGLPKTPAARWFTPMADSEVSSMCVELNTPVIMRAKRGPFSLDRRPKFTWMKNVTWLDTVQFYKRFDPSAAFQELDMFVGGVMVKQEQIAKVPDKLKIQAHGMDASSFRKDPTKVHY